MSNPFESPQFAPPPPPPPGQGDATGGVIPYKNLPALIGYYLGILGLLCCFAGLPVGLVALILGIMGLRKRAQQPEVKGSVHAWIAIVCGTIGFLGSILFAIVIITAIVANRDR